MEGARALCNSLLGQGDWEDSTRRELESLGDEKDSEIFFESLLRLAGREENAGHDAAALTLYSAVPKHSIHSDVANRAQSRHDALLGSGSFGARAEVLTRRFFREAAEPSSLIAMAGAQAVFGFVRATSLGALLASPQSLFTRGFAARSLASLSGFAFEAPAFVALGRGARWTMGKPMSSEGIGTELATSFLSLGLLKASGAAARALTARFPRMALQGLFHDGAMVAGLMTAHGLEAALGLREKSGFGDSLVDSIVTTLQLKVGGRIAQRALGNFYRDWQQGLELRSQNSGPKIFPLLSPRPAAEGMSARIPFIFQMEGFDEGGGRGRPTAPPATRWEEWRNPLLDRVSSLSIPKNVNQLVVEIHDPALSSQSARARLLDIELRMDEVFRNHLWLQEATVRLGDGTRLVYFRSPKGYLKQLEAQDAAQYSALRGHRSLSGPHRVVLWGEWRPLDSAEPLHALLARRRRELKLTPHEVAEKVAKLTDGPKVGDTIVEYETTPGHKIAYPTLKALSEVYRMDVRDLIAASNRSRFPQLDPSSWSLDAYPIYLESEADLARMERFEREDPAHRSLGWIVFSVSKNPFAYINTTAFHEAAGQGSNLLSRLIGNRDYPSLETLNSLQEHLAIPSGDLLDAANRTFHPELELKNFFEGKSVYLNPSSDDRAKVLSYRESPGSLGQALFAFRTSMPDHPGAQTLSRRLGLPGHRWDEMERNLAPPDASNWREWADILTMAGLPLKPVHRWSQPSRFSRLSAGELLQEGLGQESIKAFVDRTGFNDATIDKILSIRGTPQRFTKSETIRDLQEQLPNLHGDLLFRELRPEIRGFFPETEGSEPVLRLSPADIAFAMDFRPSRDIFAHRMEHNQELSTLGELVGVRYNTIRLYETCRICVEDPQTIGKLGRAMGIDPRRLYLHYNPQILGLFPIADPGKGGTRRIGQAEYYQLTLNHPHRFGDNQRRKLKNLAHEIGIDDGAALARHLGVEANIAKKLWDDTWEAMTLEQMELLQAKIPGFSYRANYEHFYGAALDYFLGRDAAGNFDYSPPRRPWNEASLAVAIRESAMIRYGSLKTAGKETGLNFIAKPGNLPRSLKGRGWSDATMAQAVRGLGLDRRSVFWYFRGEELQPILREIEASGAKSSSSETSRSR